MRTYLISGIFVLALTGAGCGGLTTLAYPTQTLGGERAVTFTGGGAHLEGREGGDVSRVVVASSDGYAVRTDADGRLVVATAEAARIRADARRIAARAAVTEARAGMVDDILAEVARCQRRGFDLRTCVGDVATLYMLTAEDTSNLLGLYGFGGYGLGGGSGYYFPSAAGDTVAGSSAVAGHDLSERLGRVEGATRRLTGTVDTFVHADGAADGGAR